jgi:hypothetical protein
MRNMMLVIACGLFSSMTPAEDSSCANSKVPERDIRQVIEIAELHLKRGPPPSDLVITEARYNRFDCAWRVVFRRDSLALATNTVDVIVSDINEEVSLQPGL